MRVGILFGVRTQSSDPEVASELSLCPTMSIPGCILSGSIPSLIVSAGFILGGCNETLVCACTAYSGIWSQVRANHTCRKLGLNMLIKVCAQVTNSVTVASLSHPIGMNLIST